jgi:protoheme ferro-lyase
MGGRLSLVVYVSTFNNETVVIACFLQCIEHMLKKFGSKQCLVITSMHIELTKYKE